jgi:hypothetical protein
MDGKVERYIQTKCTKLGLVERQFQQLDKAMSHLNNYKAQVTFYEKLSNALTKAPALTQTKDAEHGRVAQMNLLRSNKGISARLISAVNDKLPVKPHESSGRRGSFNGVVAKSLRTAPVSNKDIKITERRDSKVVKPIHNNKIKSEAPLPIIVKPGIEARNLAKPQKISTRPSLTVKPKALSSQNIERSLSSSRINKNEQLSVDKAINQTASENKGEDQMARRVSGKDISVATNGEWLALTGLQTQPSAEDRILRAESKKEMLPKIESEVAQNKDEVAQEVQGNSVVKENLEQNEQSTMGLFECKYEEIAQTFNSEINVDVSYEQYNDNKTLDDHDKMFLFEFLEMSKDCHADLFDFNHTLFEQNALNSLLKQIVAYLPNGRTFDSSSRFLAIQADQKICAIQSQIDSIDLQKNTYIKVK